MSCEPLSLKVIAQLSEQKIIEKVKCSDTYSHLFTVTFIIRPAAYIVLYVLTVIVIRVLAHQRCVHTFERSNELSAISA
jgi:hypothetical protein